MPSTTAALLEAAVDFENIKIEYYKSLFEIVFVSRFTQHTDAGKANDSRGSLSCELL
jgi:hypothetical protein